MISVEEAETLILENFWDPSESHTLIEEQAAATVNEALVADRPFPPFNRVAMDGVAIQQQAFQKGQRHFVVEAFQAAGDPPKILQDPSQAIEIMTGARLPVNCDAVIPYEQLTLENGVATLDNALEVLPYANIHQEGSDYAKGETLVPKGASLRSPEWAVAATVGKEKLRTLCKPKIALISTGNELVNVNEIPLPHQIRRSNTYAVRAALFAKGITDVAMFHLEDDPESMKETLPTILDAHTLCIFSGGVSAGKLDFLPEVLEDLGIQKIFHKVAQRPGKPFWYGKREQGPWVFGLPGNPNSTLVCTHRYLLPAIYYAEKGCLPSRPYAILTEEVSFDKSLTLFMPVEIEYSNDGCIYATPKPVNGSGDLVTLTKSEGFIQLDAKHSIFRKGEAFPLWLWNQG